MVLKALSLHLRGHFNSPHCVQQLFRWCPVTRVGIPLPSPGPCSAEDEEIRFQRPGDKVVVYQSGILTPLPTSKQCCNQTARPHGRDEAGPVAEVCESTRLSSATCRGWLLQAGMYRFDTSLPTRLSDLISFFKISYNSPMRTLTQKYRLCHRRCFSFIRTTVQRQNRKKQQRLRETSRLLLRSTLYKHPHCSCRGYPKFLFHAKSRHIIIILECF